MPFSENAFLSYIGLGIAPPECSWGILAKEGAKMLRIYPHELFYSGIFYLHNYVGNESFRGRTSGCVGSKITRKRVEEGYDETGKRAGSKES